MQDQTNNNDRIELSDLRTIEGLIAENPNVLTESTLRWQLRFRSTNGLDACCVSLGKQVLISKTKFEKWLFDKSGKSVAKRKKIVSSNDEVKRLIFDTIKAKNEEGEMPTTKELVLYLEVNMTAMMKHVKELIRECKIEKHGGKGGGYAISNA